jgi:hypothetical protein
VTIPGKGVAVGGSGDDGTGVAEKSGAGGAVMTGNGVGEISGNMSGVLLGDALGVPVAVTMRVGRTSTSASVSAQAASKMAMRPIAPQRRRKIYPRISSAANVEIPNAAQYATKKYSGCRRTNCSRSPMQA